jgi:hypothetical protein
VVGDYPQWGIAGGYDSETITYDYRNLLIDHNLKDNAWTVDGEATTVIFHSDSAKYHSVTGTFEITPAMIEEQFIRCAIPFNEQTFPQLPTTSSMLAQYYEGTIWDNPYRVAISLPLKQTVGDRVMTCILSDTFNLHIALPDQPVVTCIKDMPAETLSGDSLELVYEVKYLTKKDWSENSIAATELGFKLEWYSYINGLSAYESTFQGEGEDFYYIGAGKVRTFLESKGETFDDPSSPPDCLELTDMGNYYNAKVTVKHELPKPNGFKEGLENHEQYYSEPYTTILSTENYKGFLGPHPLFGQVFWHTSSSQKQSSNTKAYTVDMDIMADKYLLYGDKSIWECHKMSEWDEQGYSTDSIVRLINDANASGEFAAFDEYMQRNQKRIFISTAPESWGDMVVGITERGSNDTVYTVLKNRELYAHFPFTGGDYDIIFKYPQFNLEKVYHYKTDSIAGQIYPLKFAGYYDAYQYQYDYLGQNFRIKNDYPVNISYVNGDGDTINIVKPAVNTAVYQFYPQYIIYEPKGITGQISYYQYDEGNIQSLDGAVEVSTAKSYGAGGAPIGVLTYAKEAYSPYFDYIPCYNTGSDFIKITLIDDATGAEIPNARINYTGVNSYCFTNDLSGNPYSDDGLSGSIDAPSSSGYYLLPLDPQKAYWSMYRQSFYYALEVIADGYYNRLFSFSPYYNADANLLKNGMRVMMQKSTDNLRQASGIYLWDSSSSSKFQNLTTLGRNTITTFRHYNNTHNAMLNVNLPLANGYQPNNVKLTTQKGSVTPTSYRVVSAANGFGVLDSAYVSLTYRINDLVDAGIDEQGNTIKSNIAYPNLTYNGKTIMELPALLNDEVDPKIYEDNITVELWDNVSSKLKPNQFDIKATTAQAKNTGKSQKTALDKADGFGTKFAMPDPIPFVFETRYEDNTYYLRGIASYNLIDAIPGVGQANAILELASNINDFDDRFDELKSALKMPTYSRTPRLPSVSVFAGLRGYLEGYGKYDPITRSYEYGLNEGGVTLEASASANVKVPIGLIKVGIGVDGLVSATLGFSKPSDADWARAVNKAKFDLWLETKCSLDVWAEMSAGIDLWIASAEVGVTGRAGFENRNKLILKPYLPGNDKFVAGGYFSAYGHL